MNPDVLERLRANPRARAPAREPPTTPRRRKRPRRPIFLPLFLVLGFIALAIAGWSAAGSPALASFLSVSSTPTPAGAARQFWAQASLAKATYTPTSLPLPTSTIAAPAPAATLPPDGNPPLLAQLVADTPAPGVAASDGSTAPDTAPPAAYTGDKYILVDISEQHLYAYQGGSLLYSFVASTGIDNSTRAGNFAVQSKIPNAYGSTWDIWMPNWLGIYWSHGLENGIHALPILPNGGVLWAGFLGRPISYGCVVLGTYDSQLLYDWADYGTPVDIQW
ncbi:MAG: L,D-transpeptidase [Bacteroidota bacterium]